MRRAFRFAQTIDLEPKTRAERVMANYFASAYSFCKSVETAQMRVDTEWEFVEANKATKTKELFGSSL